MDPSPEQLRRFVEIFHHEYADYHNHKETVSYTALALYVGAFGAALVSKDWPPDWSEGWMRLLLSIVAASLAWLFALWFVGWQLLRRRMAAVRVAAAEKLLSKWVSNTPDAADSNPATNVHPASPRRWWHRFWPLWPPAAPVPAGDLKDGHYPSVVINAVRSQVSWPGSEARGHEAIITGVIHFLWLGVIVKTVLVVCLAPAA